MYNLYIALIILSACIYVFMIIRIRNINNRISKSFIRILLCFAIFSFGSLFELISEDLTIMVFFRNIQQIGIFMAPMAVWLFSYDYINSGKRYQKVVARLISAIQVTAITLVWTDSYHHLMRSHVELVQHKFFGLKLLVYSTTLGTVFVGLNFLFVLIALVSLMQFMLTVTDELRKQIAHIVIAIFTTVGFVSFLKITMEPQGIYIPYVTIVIPVSVVIYRSLIKNDSFEVIPIARNRVFDVIKDGILVITDKGTIIDYNPEMSELVKKFINNSGISVGVNINQLLEGVYQFDKNRIEPCVAKVDTPEIGYLKFSHYPISENDERDGYVITVAEVTKAINYENYLITKSLRDSMTNLYNREGFNQMTDKFFLTFEEEAKAISYVIFDLDHFKQVNDTFGHQMGDEVICQFSNVLQKHAGDSNVIARFGGEEFMVAMPNTDKYQAKEFAESVRLDVESTTVMFDGVEVSYSVSVGIADTGDAHSKEDLLKLADQALYLSKSSGRNTTTIYNNKRTKSIT